MKKLNSYYIAISILTIIPVVIGVLLVTDLFAQKAPITSTNETPKLVEPKVSMWKVTDDVLHAPPENAPADQIQAYVALVLKQAKETSIMRLKNCKPDPVVVKVPKSGKVMVENTDSVDHMIVFGPGQTATIPKNSQTEISIPFPDGIRIIGYGCDGSPNGVGRFVAP